MIVGFYARVSSDEQRERSTINSQTDYARRRAELEGWTLRMFLDEGVSGTVPLEQRPAGADLLRAMAAHEIGMVTTYKLDRLGRTQLVILNAIERFKALGVPYRSLTEPFDTGSAFGEASIGMLAVFAQLDRATFLERSHVGSRRVAKQDGRWLGGIVPFGYRKKADMTLGIDEAPMPGSEMSEADVVREIFRLCGTEGRSTQRIAEDLNRRGIPTVYARDDRQPLMGDVHGTRGREGKRRRATAGQWSPGAVGRILHNTTYAGRHSYGRRTKRKDAELITRLMPPIVSPALFEKAQRQLKANTQWKSRAGTHLYRLRGILSCACGHSLIGQTYPTKAGPVYTYRCVAHPKGSAIPTVREERVASILWRDVLSFVEHPNEILRAIAHSEGDAGVSESKAESELLGLAGELRELDEQEGRLLDAVVAQTFSPEIIEARLQRLRATKDGVKRRMAQVRTDRAAAAQAARESDSVKSTLRGIGRAARKADERKQADVLRLLVRSAVAERTDAGVTLRVTYRFSSESALVLSASTDTGSSRPAA